MMKWLAYGVGLKITCHWTFYKIDDHHHLKPPTEQIKYTHKLHLQSFLKRKLG